MVNAEKIGPWDLQFAGTIAQIVHKPKFEFNNKLEIIAHWKVNSVEEIGVDFLVSDIFMNEIFATTTLQPQFKKNWGTIPFPLPQIQGVFLNWPPLKMRITLRSQTLRLFSIMGGGQSGTLTLFRNRLLTGQHLANSRGGQLKKNTLYLCTYDVVSDSVHKAGPLC